MTMYQDTRFIIKNEKSVNVISGRARVIRTYISTRGIQIIKSACNVQFNLFVTTCMNKNPGIKTRQNLRYYHDQ